MNLNTEDKKRAGYRIHGLLGIPKYVVVIIFGLVLCFEDVILGICLVGAGIIGLLIHIYYVNKGKDERSQQ